MTRPDVARALALLGQRPLFVHAHPDDETIVTGALIAALTEAGARCDLVTCTRGEQGESTLPDLTGEALITHRLGELSGAVAVLGVHRHAFLGGPPARVGDRPPRRYEDSGMEWVRPGLAGPAADVGPDAFTSADLAEAVADLVALCATWRPTCLVSYDDGGGYGHPDHVRAHHVSMRAARRHGVPFVEVLTDLPDGMIGADEADAGLVPVVCDAHLPVLRAALTRHASQLTVGDDGITHVGGQHEPFRTRVGLRFVPVDD